MLKMSPDYKIIGLGHDHIVWLVTGALVGVGVSLFAAAFDVLAFAGVSQSRYFMLFWYFVFILAISAIGCKSSDGVKNEFCVFFFF